MVIVMRLEQIIMEGLLAQSSLTQSLVHWEAMSHEKNLRNCMDLTGESNQQSPQNKESHIIMPKVA